MQETAKFVGELFVIVFGLVSIVALLVILAAFFNVCFSKKKYASDEKTDSTETIPEDNE